MRQPVAIKAKPFPVLFETEKESVQNRPPVKRTTLTFKDPAKEAAFNNYATFRSLPFIRLSIVLAIGLYCVFAFLDPIITPAMVTEITIIRVISILFFGLILYLSFTDWGYKNLQFMMGIVVLFASCGIIAMILLTEASGGYLYYAALILAIIYAHNLLRLRFIYATLTTWIVILFYASATVWLQTTPFHIYLNNMFFLVSANILGMSASYWLEYYMKDVFWKEQTLKEKSDQLNIENNRKTEELAAAREIQLSMLPNELPDYDDYLFAFSMNPASEVGGDYYDYCITDKNRMTFGIGDATGHGLQASLMVTAIKLLFSEHAGRTEIVQFLKQASHSISLMGFRKIYLAFAIGRLENHTLELAGAGMPHALIFHKKTGCVEQIALKGLPLGNNVQFPYHKTEIAMESGDMVLMMTDGLPELYDSNGKMIGYQKVSELFYENAHLKPTELIENLNYYAKNWVNGTLQNDDITFFAFKRL